MNAAPLHVALVGNPNCGKTALFNQLTGARQKVANYAGVTVERKQGHFVSARGTRVTLLDLPGAYSFQSASPDERITRDVLNGDYPGETQPDLIVCVADATNLRLHLRFVLEVKRLGRPMLLALNMMDDAARRGIRIDVAELEKRLGIAVIPTIAVKRNGVVALVDAIDGVQRDAIPATPPAGTPASDIHEEVRALLRAAVTIPERNDARVERIDRIVLHPVFGMLILAFVMFVVFQSVYLLGRPMTDAIGDAADWTGKLVGGAMSDGPLRGLLTDGVINGLGTVIGFLPEILVLFFAILVLEESGYLPRAAFLLDRVMLSVGLSGRSFIPLLSSFACAIPGVIATRSISDARDRLMTILVAPLMTCSARLPVYALLIGACVPNRSVAGVISLQGLVLFALYAAGIGAALLVGWIGKLLGARVRNDQALLMELPSYRLPRVRDIAIGLWERAAIFLKRLTGVILALTVLLWFLSTFPAPPQGAVGPAINYSFAGYLGHALSYLFSPLGFNWQISLSLIPAFAARETAVSALATVYAVATNDSDTTALAHALNASFSLPTALSLLVWFAFAPQCMSTLAVIRRETRSWRNVAISFTYMFVLAYAASFATYHVAMWLS